MDKFHVVGVKLKIKKRIFINPKSFTKQMLS